MTPTPALTPALTPWTTSTRHPRLEYADLRVPLDHSDPSGAELTLAIGRIRARRPDARRGVLVVVHGGPGGDGGLGRDLPVELAGTAAAEVHDLVGIDLRGTNASTRLDGEDVPAGAPFDSRPPDAVFAAITDDMRERERGCERAGGPARRHFSTRNVVRDVDLVRAALGEASISMVGYAYGSRVVAVYGTMFGDRLDRSVIDSAVNPEWDWRTQFMHQAVAIRENVDAWAGWAGRRHGHFELGGSAPAVHGSLAGAAASLERLPGGIALRTSFDMVVADLATARPRWAVFGHFVRDLTKAARSGDAEAARSLLGEQAVWRPGHTAGELREAVLEAVTCETPWPTDLETYYADMRRFRDRCPYGLGVMRVQPWVGTFCSFEPPEPPPEIRRGAHPNGLVVQADGDVYNHHAGGTAMAQRLGHHLVWVRDSGGHELYGRSGHAGVDAVVDRYLVDGTLPAEQTTTLRDAERPDVPEDAPAHLIPEEVRSR